MLDPSVLEPSKDRGYANGFVYYVRGRGGVLGEVDADVVISAFGFFAPALIRKMWERGAEVEGACECAATYALACAEFGRDRLSGYDGAARFIELTERVVDAVAVPGLALFSGWRAQPRPSDDIGRAYLLAHVMREWRGSAHVVASVATGLTPLEAILTKNGPGGAKLFGWGEVFDDVDHLAESRQAAEDLTDRICAAAFEAALTATERAELVDLAEALRQLVAKR